MLSKCLTSNQYSIKGFLRFHHLPVALWAGDQAFGICAPGQHSRSKLQHLSQEEEGVAVEESAVSCGEVVEFI